MKGARGVRYQWGIDGGERQTENRQDERVGSKYCSWWQPSSGLHRLAPPASSTGARAPLCGLLVGLCRPLESLWAGEGEELSWLWVKLRQILVQCSLQGGSASFTQLLFLREPNLGILRCSSGHRGCGGSHPALVPARCGRSAQDLPPPQGPLGRFWSHQHEDSPSVKQQSW